MDQISSVMAEIVRFDEIKQDAIEARDRDIKADAKLQLQDNSTGYAGADSVNFTSTMHNLVAQMLLAAKAEATVQEALQTIEREEKPVIGLYNTMGSAIKRYAEETGIRPGEPIEINFGDLLKHYLERSREVTVRDAYGNSVRERLSDAELGYEGVAVYESILEQIDEIDFSNLPVSPIDYIRTRLEREGVRFEEVTGRSDRIEYGINGEQTYRIRTTEKGPAANQAYVQRFNNGEVDAILLNSAGSTGISLHASETFADQRPRHMIIAQAPPNITDFMQMLGRIHRTGQVELPSFTVLAINSPAEKRPLAVLLNKLASLNANTTAARNSAFNLDTAVDWMNEYGDDLVTEIMANHPQIHAKLDYPLGRPDEEFVAEDAVRRVTGRIPLLSIKEQEWFYTLFETEYQDFVQRQEALGESILEAKTLDLDARTLAQMEVQAAEHQGDNNPFTQAVYLEVIDAKTPRKPYTQLQVINQVREKLGLNSIKEVAPHDFEEVANLSQQVTAQTLEQIQSAVVAYKAGATAHKKQEAAEKINQAVDRQLAHLTKTMELFPVGQTVRVVTSGKNIFYGTVTRIWSPEQQNATPDHKLSNPVAPSSWKMQLLLADTARELTIPLSKVNRSTQQSVSLTPAETDFFGVNIYELFDQRQVTSRETRQVFTGNILRAYSMFNGKGQVVNFTDNKGRVRQGILMPKGFEIEKTLQAKPVEMPAPEEVLRFITTETNRTGVVKTLDEALSIKANQHQPDEYILTAAASKKAGGKYYLDSDLLAAAGSDFHSVGGSMRCRVSADRILMILNTLMSEKNIRLAAFDQRDVARKMLGIELPTLEKIEQEASAEPQMSGDVEDSLDSQEFVSVEDSLKFQKSASFEEGVNSKVEELASEKVASLEGFYQIPNSPDNLEVEPEQPEVAGSDRISLTGDTPDVSGSDRTSFNGNALDMSTSDRTSLTGDTPDVSGSDRTLLNGDKLDASASDRTLLNANTPEAPHTQVQDKNTELTENLQDDKTDIELQSDITDLSPPASPAPSLPQTLPAKVRQVIDDATTVETRAVMEGLPAPTSFGAELFNPSQAAVLAQIFEKHPQYRQVETEKVALEQELVGAIKKMHSSWKMSAKSATTVAKELISYVEEAHSNYDVEQNKDNALFNTPLGEFLLNSTLLADSQSVQISESEDAFSHLLPLEERANLLSELVKIKFLNSTVKQLYSINPEYAEVAFTNAARDTIASKYLETQQDEYLELVNEPEQCQDLISALYQEYLEKLNLVDKEMVTLPTLESKHLESQPPVQPLIEPAVSPTTGQVVIAKSQNQRETGAKRVATLLHRASLAAEIMKAEDFHLKIENDPYIPLVIERHGNQLYLTHYLEQNGDIFIDSEMVYRITTDGSLYLQEVATQNPFTGGEARSYDKGFAATFAQNLLHQGFDEAAVLAWKEASAAQSLVSPEPIIPIETTSETIEIEPEQGENNSVVVPESTISPEETTSKTVEIEPEQHKDDSVLIPATVEVNEVNNQPVDLASSLPSATSWSEIADLTSFDQLSQLQPSQVGKLAYLLSEHLRTDVRNREDLDQLSGLPYEIKKQAYLQLNQSEKLRIEGIKNYSKFSKTIGIDIEQWSSCCQAMGKEESLRELKPWVETLSSNPQDPRLQNVVAQMDADIKEYHKRTYVAQQLISEGLRIINLKGQQVGSEIVYRQCENSRFTLRQEGSKLTIDDSRQNGQIVFDLKRGTTVSKLEDYSGYLAAFEQHRKQLEIQNQSKDRCHKRKPELEK